MNPHHNCLRDKSGSTGRKVFLYNKCGVRNRNRFPCFYQQPLQHEKIHHYDNFLHRNELHMHQDSISEVPEPQQKHLKKFL